MSRLGSAADDLDRADREASKYRFRAELTRLAVATGMPVENIREVWQEGEASPLCEAMFADDQKRRYNEDNASGTYRSLTDVLHATYIHLNHMPHDDPKFAFESLLLPKDDFIEFLNNTSEDLPTGAERTGDYGYRFRGGKADDLRNYFKPLKDHPHAIDTSDDGHATFDNLISRVALHHLGGMLMQDVETAIMRDGSNDTRLTTANTPDDIIKVIDDLVEAQTQDLETDLAR